MQSTLIKNIYKIFIKKLDTKSQYFTQIKKNTQVEKGKKELHLAVVKTVVGCKNDL